MRTTSQFLIINATEIGVMPNSQIRKTFLAQPNRLIMKNKTLTGNPNFSIILPGNCQASCSFCCWKFQTTPRRYVDHLRRTLNKLPPEFKRVTLTGGEPTLSGYLGVTVDVLRDSRDWDAIVLSSNGAKLGDYTDLDIDHVNLSRHHYDPKKISRIFNTSEIPSDNDVIDIIDKFNRAGIDVTLVALLCDQFAIGQIIEYIKYARMLGASAVTFRTNCHDNSIKAPKEMKWVSNYNTNDRWSCEACRIWTQIIGGMRVQWKAAKAEPSRIHGIPYELILQQNCKLTTDWAGKDEWKSCECKQKDKHAVPKKTEHRAAEHTIINTHSPADYRCGCAPRCG